MIKQTLKWLVDQKNNKQLKKLILSFSVLFVICLNSFGQTLDLPASLKIDTSFAYLQFYSNSTFTKLSFSSFQRLFCKAARQFIKLGHVVWPQLPFRKLAQGLSEHMASLFQITKWKKNHNIIVVHICRMNCMHCTFICTWEFSETFGWF